MLRESLHDPLYRGVTVKLSQPITPYCLIDETKLIRNAARVAAVADTAGVSLRPHVKTLKSLEAARLYAPAPMPITVSTLAEARAFAEAGYSDILYAVGMTPNKLDAINELLVNGVQLTVIIDSLPAAEALAGQANRLHKSLAVAVEIDADGHRAGIGAEDPVLLQIAQCIAEASNLVLVGVMTHAGASYQCFDEEGRQHMAQQECDQAVIAAARLRKQGHAVTMISAGSTPTVLSGIDYAGVTELRAGVYATFDCVMAGLGVCCYQDIAMSVVTTVIGHQADKGWVLVDAGWMALSRDTGTASQPRDCGYGLVCDINGHLLDGWYVKHTNQEHGVIVHRDGAMPDLPQFAFGQPLRILPVHACATGGQFDQYHVTQDNQTISERWSRVNGW